VRLNCRRVLVILAELLVFAEVTINVLGKGSVFEGVSAEIILRKRKNVGAAHLSFDEVLEGAVLLAGLALVPVLNLRVAHARAHLFSLDALVHALIKSVAGVRC